MGTCSPETGVSLLHIASKLKPRNGTQQLTGRQSGGSRQGAEVNLTIPKQGHYARLLCSHLGAGPALGFGATPASNSNRSPVLQRRPTAQIYPQLCDELVRRLQQLCTLAQQVETAGAVPVEQGPWRGEHLPALLNGSGCRDQGATGAACLDHTEFLSRRPGAEDTAMALVAGSLRTTLATRHIPLAEVPRRLTPEAVEGAIRLSIAEFSYAAPSKGLRLGMCGLNPHAGEGGLFRGVMKLDRDSGNAEVHDFGSRAVSLEPVSPSENGPSER